MCKFTLPCAIGLAMIIPARAAVTDVAWYRLGENDPGAASGLAVTNTTADLIGVKHLKQFGSPLYTNAVSAAASNRVSSTTSVHFNGINQYFSNTVVSTAVDNFGMEAWVKPNATNFGVHIIAANGRAPDGGWTIFQFTGRYRAFFAGILEFGDAPATPGVWAHLALVRNNGQTTFYFNGSAAGTAMSTPYPPVAGFTIGATPGFPASAFFDGCIDEVRVFTFAPGQFSTNDLLINYQRTETYPATAVSGTNATLNGRTSPLGLATSAWFEWGLTTNYGNVAPPQNVGSGAPVNFNQTINGLLGGVEYHFRAAVSNSSGLAFGADQSFTTPPTFSSIAANLPGVDERGSAAWGDYDNDGRLDILLTGYTGPGTLISQVWRNTGSSFTNINAGLPGVYESSAVWGDYDNDGRLDILLTGNNGTLSGICQVWRNTGTGFTNINLPLTGVEESSVAWGDYDNDGRPDILLTGDAGIPTSPQFISQVWRNTGNGFVNINAGLPGVHRSSVAWGDYDNDGRLDILLAGDNVLPPVNFISQVWRNTGSGFTNINAGLPGLGYPSVAWGDYDNDGRLDILQAGLSTNSIWIWQVWRNTGSGFANINVGAPGNLYNSAAWGDYDNDGRLDILLAGLSTNNTWICQVWRNTMGGFTNLNVGLPAAPNNSAAWGDYNNDGRLDVLLTAINSNYFTQVWRNDNGIMTNTAPAPPSSLTATLSGNSLILGWNAASDLQTPAAGLSYNLRIGTTPGGSDILAPSAAPNGWRRLPALGNAQHGATTLFNFTVGTPYYWSVQAVDGAFAASPFSAESTFKLLQRPQPAPVFVPLTATNLLNGDLNGDGLIDQIELQVLLADYFSSSPFLQMTNIADLGSTNITFALTNSIAGAFSVEYTTNFADWYFLGPATPRYRFTDTNAPAAPERYYRLRWP